MTNFDDFFTPANKFIVPISVHLSDTDKRKLQKFINLHYLGDENANELVDGQYQPKYPEKETAEFKNAVANITLGHTAFLSVEFDTNGVPTFEVVKND